MRRLVSLLLILLLATPVWARPASEADVAARMRQLLALIHQHAVVDVSDSGLVAGAFDQLRQAVGRAGPEPSGGGLEARLRALAGDRLPWERVEHLAVQGMLTRLNDPWAALLSPEAYAGLRQRTYASSHAGIGLIVFRQGEVGAMLACQPHPDTPAARAGVRGGDELVSIDAQSVQGLSESEVRVSLQAPPGSTLRLGLRRQGALLAVRVECRAIDSDLVSSRLVELRGRRVAFIQVGTFATTTPDAVARALDELRAEACVLDLRNNGGGQVSAAVRLASLFLEPGQEIASVHRRAGVEQLRAAPAGLRFPGRLVVLINENSASAAELVAGALRERAGAVLVGQKSFGKGAVQRILALPDGSAFKLTTAHYRTPSGRSIEGRGLDPDLPAQTPPESLGGPADEQLRVALECATR